jgi:hypothetical protein
MAPRTRCKRPALPQGNCPELRRERRVGTSLGQLGLVLLGAAVMALPLLLE